MESVKLLSFFLTDALISLPVPFGLFFIIISFIVNIIPKAEKNKAVNMVITKNIFSYILSVNFIYFPVYIANNNGNPTDIYTANIL